MYNNFTNSLRLINNSSSVYSRRTMSTLNNKSEKIKDMSLWGTNLGSTTKYGRLTKVVRNMIKLPSYQKSVIVGLLLSDGWLSLSASNSEKKC